MHGGGLTGGSLLVFWALPVRKALVIYRESVSWLDVCALKLHQQHTPTTSCRCYCILLLLVLFYFKVYTPYQLNKISQIVAAL